MEEPEQPVPSPIEEREIAHLGRAASAMGFADKGGVNAYLSNRYERLHLWCVAAKAYNDKHEKDQVEKK